MIKTFTIANVGDRLVAFIIDATLLSVYTISMTSLLFSMDVDDEFIWIALVVVPVIFYSLIFELATGGQTPGKKAMKLRAVSLDGRSASVGQLIIRWFFITIGIYFFSGLVAFIVILSNDRGQRLGDIVAGTKVVKLNSESQSVQHHLQFPSVSLLSAYDIELAERAIYAHKELDNPEPANIVSVKLKEVIGIDSDLPATQLLSIIIKDFRNISSR